MHSHTSARHHAFDFQLPLGLLLASYMIQGAHAQNYDYTGGVALRYPNTTCPYNTDYIGTSLYANCCPDWTKGAPSGSGYCCPTAADCYVTVAKAPKCAEQEWTYCYDPDSDAKIGFCCLQDWDCIVVKDTSTGESLGVGCNPPGVKLAATESQASTSLSAYQLPSGTSTSAAATTGSTSTKKASTTTAPATSTPAATNTQSPTADSTTGLSTGAKAGIGVGGAIAGVALIGVVVWLTLLFRKRGDRVNSSVGDGHSYGQPQSPPVYGAAKVAPVNVGEMSSGYYEARELDSNSMVHRSELEGSNAAHEIGSPPKWR